MLFYVVKDSGCKVKQKTATTQYLKYGILTEHKAERLINLNEQHIEQQ